MSHSFFLRLRSFFGRPEVLAYFLLRVAFGLMLITHGLPKILGTSHGSMASPMAGSVNLIANVLHLPAAPVIGWFIALLEGLGGLMLALGLLTRPLAAMVTVQMLVICWILGPTFPWIDRGFEYPLMLAFVSFYLLMRGGGQMSLDARIWRKPRSVAPLPAI